MSAPWINAVVVNRTMTTARVVVLDLEPDGDASFPDHEAGAHIDVLVADGASNAPLTRQYSLCGTPGDRSRYRIAVLRDERSRGGSVAMHQVQVGQRLRISAPRNHFKLTTARRHRLYAGGIGITPLLAMAEQLDSVGGDYRLHYSARSAADVSFAELLAENPRVTLHLDDGPAEQRLDPARDIGAPTADTAVYVCGPGPYIDHVLAAAAGLGWPEAALHKERFAATAAALAPGDEFTVELASSGAQFAVPPEETILDVLARNGIDAPSSCQQGICGECVVKVLAGQPDHRDDVLSDAEHDQGLFTPCCSRSTTPILEIDL